MKKIYKKVLIVLLLVMFGRASAQEFITRWNLATAGSGATQLTFGTATSGTVNYYWQEISPGSAVGSGTFSGTALTITGLPTGATIRLGIYPTNFQRININNGADKNRLRDVEQWGSTVWTSMATAFNGCGNLNITATDIPVLTSCTSMEEMFQNCSILNGPTNINSWNTAAVTNMREMFFNANSFNRNIGSWNTAAVTNMSGMFFFAPAFNRNIGSWNTAAVTDMNTMFWFATAFNQNIGSWNTAAVTDMSFMFRSATAFNQNIGSWNTAAVTNMAGMFQGASAFNQNIGSWNTAAVTNMNTMFNNATAFNQNIGSWNTAAVTNMLSMFFLASAFNQNIGSWNLNATVNMGSMLNDCGMDCDNYSKTLFGWNANPSCPANRTLGANGRTYGPAAVAARNNLVLATGSGGKGWTITSDALNSGCSVVLPIELLSFSGNCNTNTTNLKWVTATQANNDYFSIERSSDGVNYTVLGILDGAGSSAQTLYYSFSDTTPREGLSYYRLKQTDFDGQFEYSKIIAVKCDNEILEVKINPNPVSNELTIEMPGNTQSENFEIISSTGAVIYKGSFTQKTTLQTSGFSNGIYMIKFSNNHINNLKKFIKQ